MHAAFGGNVLCRVCANAATSGCSLAPSCWPLADWCCSRISHFGELVNSGLYVRLQKNNTCTAGQAGRITTCSSCTAYTPYPLTSCTHLVLVLAVPAGEPPQPRCRRLGLPAAAQPTLARDVAAAAAVAAAPAGVHVQRGRSRRLVPAGVHGRQASNCQPAAAGAAAAQPSGAASTGHAPHALPTL